MQGKFFWYDIMTSDTAAARRFYADVVGWATQDASAGEQEYTVFTVNGQGVAGLMPIPPDVAASGSQPHWKGYIAVDDVDQATADLQARGGTVHKPPFEVPGVIRMAVVADPQGAVFLLAKGLVDEPMPEMPAGTPGTIGWRELYASEWNEAVAFYQKMFGWTKDRAIDMGPGGTYQLFRTGDADAAGGMMTKPDAIPMPYWGFYFVVAELDAAVKRVTTGGGSILNGPMQVPGDSWIVNCMDPQGAVFSLVAPKR